MTPLRSFGSMGFVGQYHSQSDRHSKVACWATMFNLLEESPLIRRHAEEGKIVFGVNHSMGDFKNQRKKKLDLVIARPGEDVPRSPRTFAELADMHGVVLSELQQERLRELPRLEEGTVGSVLVALEAKATMTKHVGSLPRLYDELNSSHLTVHGSADQAIAVGFTMINHADRFLSPGYNPQGTETSGELRYTSHAQPAATVLVATKIHELPRRTRPGEEGFDAIGIVVIDCVNDGSPVSIVTSPPAPDERSDYHYDQMIRRIENQYAYRFSHV